MASTYYEKVVRRVGAAVVIEATELGDVLLTAGLSFMQGVEVPSEQSFTTVDTLTQSIAFTFWIEMLAHNESPDPAPPGNVGIANGAPPFWGSPPNGACCCSGDNVVSPLPPNTCKNPVPPPNATCLRPGQCSWSGVWRYRRSTTGSAGPTSIHGVNVGDVSMQNWGHGNDMPAVSIMLPTAMARTQVAQGNWSGGVNITAIRLAEERSFGWFHSLRLKQPTLALRLRLNRE